MKHSILLNAIDSELILLKDLITAFAYYKIVNFKRASEIFENLLHSDIKQLLGCGPTVGLVACNIEDSSINVKSSLLDFAIDDVINLNTSDNFIPFYFSFDDVFLAILKKKENTTTDKKEIGRIRALRGNYYYLMECEDISLRAVNDLKYAYKIFPENNFICTSLIDIFNSKNNYLEAYNYFIKYVKANSYKLNADQEHVITSSFISDANDVVFSKILSDFKTFLTSSQSGVKSFLANTTLKDVVEKLYEQKKYTDIISIIEMFNLQQLTSSDILFEIAYSYVETQNESKAKMFYEKYLENLPNSNAALNNLALIYEHLGNLDKAKELLKTATNLQPDDDTAKRNLNRVTKSHEDYLKTCELFKKENIWIKTRLQIFLNNEDSNGLIACSYAQLPKYLATSDKKASELIKIFLDKNYLFKVEHHNLQTNSNVYSFNPYIRKCIIGLAGEFEKEKEFINIAETLNSTTLKNIGYDSNLTNSLLRVSDIDLQTMLQRDLRENAISLVVKNYKAVLIISGSIIEALMLEKISKKGISTYILQNGKNAKLLDMALNDLLYVANSEKLISNQHYHLSHALRGFRNLIHPGVEQRKNTLEITETNAKLAWEITKKIILDI